MTVSPTSPESMTAADVVAELREIVAAGRGNDTLARRLEGGSLIVLFEFPEPYTMRVSGDDRRVDEGGVPYEDADVVIRAEPLTLHRLTSGELGGREAIVGGLLDIRKAPELNKLLLMRGMFNVHKKARARGEAP
ncbi:hypothetical protein [Actinomadura rugatobispora]|uniref:SCP2 sterol-binding domain-containing protein n=1 Tax=Actinomadura rugatobispora TaxID=1994 RepID=A0ABW1AG47_9ACTN|nr:hypothetical protein GCM10010200_020150 [Actinomadura rugatobispora]